MDIENQEKKEKIIYTRSSDILGTETVEINGTLMELKILLPKGSKFTKFLAENNKALTSLQNGSVDDETAKFVDKLLYLLIPTLKDENIEIDELPGAFVNDFLKIYVKKIFDKLGN